MTIFEQMGNIYSEVGRSFNARNRNDEKGVREAVGRAIDLFDATVELLVANKSPRVKEVLRAKESYLSAIFDETDSWENEQSLNRYFMQFAVAARLNR